MKHLSEILSSTEVRSFTASAEHEITGLTFDSREVKAGDCFFALRGTQVDGHDYIERAVEAGAAAVVCEQLPERLGKHRGLGRSLAARRDVQPLTTATDAGVWAGWREAIGRSRENVEQSSLRRSADRSCGNRHAHAFAFNRARNKDRSALNVAHAIAGGRKPLDVEVDDALVGRG